MSRATIVIAAGGTGGHIFPALAVAESIRALADVDVVFFGTREGIEAQVVPERGFRFEGMNVEPIKGRGGARAVRGALVAARATLRSLALVREIRPSAALGVGGYVSGPVTLAAAILGVPTAILEPNSVPGLANRLLAPLARRAYLAWEQAAPSFRSRAIRRHGVPLRPGFSERDRDLSSAPSGQSRVLIMGGSQGAAVLNERLPEAIGRLIASRGAVSARIGGVLHQTGRGRDDAVREAYARARVPMAAVVPFIDDVARAIRDADLIVARAGAGTIAEIAAVGRAAILVPFPHAADDHQGKNAEAFARAGAAVCLRQEVADVPTLASTIERMLTDDRGRVEMATASRAHGRPDAADRVARDLLD
ncbi:MAG: undecaprenyldiphospho-muramoylpentapeptide beta-N-acetylglucosaminyltransferase, partial [Polyangiaceae bacterium]